jgi:hypothetical protein
MGGKSHELTINELHQNLLKVGYTANVRKKALQQAAETRGISPVEEYEEIKEGWVGKPESLLHICW